MGKKQVPSTLSGNSELNPCYSKRSLYCVYCLSSVDSVMSDSSVARWAVACLAPLSMGLSRQEYWGGLPCPPPGDLPDPGIKLASPASQEDSLPQSHMLCILVCNKPSSGPKQWEVQTIDFSWNKIILRKFFYFKSTSYCFWGWRLTATSVDY